MKKVLGLSSILLIIIGMVFILTSCGKDKIKTEYEIYDPFFVKYFSNEDDIDLIHVSSLESYYYEDTYYYVVSYTKDGDDFFYELLYIFGGRSMKRHFSLKYEWECYEYFPEYYEAFLEAKEKGIKKTYSNAEIANMINSFYGRTIVDDQN